MDPLVAAATAVVVLLAELPDKSMLAVLILSGRYARGPVVAGACAAFAVHVAIAVLGGQLLGLLDPRLTAGLVAVVLGVAAVLLFRSSLRPAEAPSAVDEEVEADLAATRSRLGARGQGSIAVASATFALVFVGEWGDLTQVVVATRAAQHDALSVALGAIVGLWAAVGLAVTAGKALLRRISARLFARIAAAVLACFALAAGVTALRG